MTPLDYALHYKHSEVTLAMVMHPTRGEDIVSMETKNYGSLIEGLVINMPDVMMAILDKGIVKSNNEAEDSKGFYVSLLVFNDDQFQTKLLSFHQIKYDFRCLEDLNEDDSKRSPLPFLNVSCNKTSITEVLAELTYIFVFLTCVFS